eukprot:364608-Chlamydomonas_euryale.AAC.3
MSLHKNLDGRMDGIVDGGMGGRMDGRVGGGMDGRMDGRVGGGMGGRMDGRAGGGMDGTAARAPGGPWDHPWQEVSRAQKAQENAHVNHHHRGDHIWRSHAFRECAQKVIDTPSRCPEQDAAGCRVKHTCAKKRGET